MLKSIMLTFLVIASAQIRSLPDSEFVKPPYPSIAPEEIEMEFILGTDNLFRFSEKTSEFYPPNELRRAQILRIDGFGNSIQIRRVRIIYMSGYEEPEAIHLQGELAPQGFRQILLSGESLYRVEITAAPKFFWQQPGNYVLRANSRR